MHQAVVKGGRNEFKRGRKNQVNLRMICVKNCLKSREYSYSSKLDFWKKGFNAAYTRHSRLDGDVRPVRNSAYPRIFAFANPDQ